MKVKKSYFSRNRHRENEEEDIFNTAYKNLSFIANTFLPIIQEVKFYHQIILEIKLEN
jgi:hypothetical protein